MDAIGSISPFTRVPSRVEGLDSSKDASSATGFGDAIGNALNELSDMQRGATNLAREFQADNPNVSVEETMIALQKASLGFQAVVQVRNKLVQAYTDVMNMPV